MKAIVTVTLKPSILDPQGEAVAHALNHMGVKGVKSVRIGKHIELEIEGGEEKALRAKSPEPPMPFCIREPITCVEFTLP